MKLTFCLLLTILNLFSKCKARFLPPLEYINRNPYSFSGYQDGQNEAFHQTFKSLPQRYDVEYFPEGYQQPTYQSSFYDEDQDEMPINAQNPQFKPKHFDNSRNPIFSSMNYLSDYRDMSDENDEHMNYIDPAFSHTATWTRPNFYPSGTEVLRYLKKKKL